MLKLLTKVTPRFGSALLAYAWYRVMPRRCNWSRPAARQRRWTMSMPSIADPG
jgi:hypothetical protein